MNESPIKGGAILNVKQKKEEVKVTANMPEPKPVVGEVVSIQMPPMLPKAQRPSLVHPPLNDLYAPRPMQVGRKLEKRSNGKGAHFDAPDVRHHIVHSLSARPKLLRAYLRSSIG